METTNIMREIAALPPEAQQEVVDFVAFLKTRYLTARSTRRRIKLADEPFIGMWKDRKDMREATAWVRNLRQSEWGA
jgi:hypothetical protein